MSNKEKKQRQRKQPVTLLIVLVLFVLLLAALAVANPGSLSTTIARKPAKVLSFTAVGRESKSTEIDSNDRILFSWQVQKNGAFHHVKLERLDKGKTKELDLAGFSNNRTANRVNIDLVPYWLEQTNKFRLSACPDAACTSPDTKEVTIKVADFDPDRKPGEKPEPSSAEAPKIESFIARGKKSGTAAIGANDNILFVWHLNTEGTLHHLKMVKVDKDNEKEQVIDLGRFSNNRQAGGVNVDILPEKNEKEITFRLYACADKECVKSTTKEAKVSVLGNPAIN